MIPSTLPRRHQIVPTEVPLEKIPEAGEDRMFHLKFWERNLIQLMRMISSVPEHNVCLSEFWRGSVQALPHCGSVACLGGWTPVWPYFQKMGIHRDGVGTPRVTLTYEMHNFRGTRSYAGHELAMWLTGDADMFDPAMKVGVSDKREALQRVTKRLRVVQNELARLGA